MLDARSPSAKPPQLLLIAKRFKHERDVARHEALELATQIALLELWLTNAFELLQSHSDFGQAES